MTNKRVSEKTEKAEKILKAARAVLARYGYVGTTVSRVAEEADVSRGLLHYHFKNKDEILAKVLRANLEGVINLFEHHFDRCDSSTALTFEIVELMKSKVATDPDYFKLFLEGLAAARHSEIVRNELGELYRRFRDTLNHGLRKMVEAGAISPVIPVRDLATLITAMLDGFGIQIITVLNAEPDDHIWMSLRKGLELLMNGPSGGMTR